MSTSARAIERALRVAAEHPAVRAVRRLSAEGSSSVHVELDIDANLPGPWHAEGASENGVHAVETVRLVFAPTYPITAPNVFLRDDFEVSHPHLQPLQPGTPPRPCFFAGSTRELLRARGIVGLVDQIADWLEKAALVQLIDPEQGWEPTRRDDFHDIVEADADWLRSHADGPSRGGVYRSTYGVRSDLADPHYFVEAGRQHVPLRLGLQDTFSHRDLDIGRIGTSLVIVAAPGKDPSGKPVVARRYAPENVHDLASLHARAREFGCDEALRAKLGLLQQRLATTRMTVPVPLTIFLLARRPCDVIGAGSPIELCPYVVELAGGDDLSPSSLKPVRIAMHLDGLSVSLLRRASGDTNEARPRWSLVGCGSLGSKIALHMARCGRGPACVVDDDTMRPHNFARHALLPESGEALQSGNKADLLASVLEKLSQPATARCSDVLLMPREELASVFHEDQAFVLNATGSLSVREGLAVRAPRSARARIVEASLLGGGAVAFMSVEGPGANPSSTDLAVEGYWRLRSEPEIREAVFGARAQAIATGQGCASVTFPMPDARLSALAAPMAEAIARMTRDGLPPARGEVVIGTLAADALGQVWTRHAVEPWTLVQGDQPGMPKVRLSPRAHEAILRAVGERPGVETGGVLVGRFVDVTETFHVVDVLPAPADSTFAPHEFVLGTQGLAQAHEDIVLETGGAIQTLGTWHCHLVTSGPSATDLTTAARLAASQGIPALLLIHTPDGYRILTAEQIRAARSDARSAQ